MIKNLTVTSTQEVAELKEFWTRNNFQTGLRYIDVQHAWLVSLILKIAIILKNPPPDNISEIISDAIKRVLDYTESHFKAEETLFAAFAFPDSENHIKQHRSFAASIEKIISRSAMINLESGEKLYRYLRQWLSQHILKEDKSYADFFRKRKFDSELFFYEHALDGIFSLTDYQVELFSKIKTESKQDRNDKESIVWDKIRDIWYRFKLKLDIPLIDIQHLWLIRLVFRLELALHEVSAERKVILEEILRESIIYVEEHFRTEEILMEKMNYPLLNEHKEQHKLLVESVLNRKSEIDNGNERAANLLAIDLKEWLFSHIALEDKKFARTLKERREEGIRISKQILADQKAHIRRIQLELYKNIVLGD